LIKTEKQLLRLIWKEMGLGGHNVDIKKRAVITKEVRKAVEIGMENTPPEQRENMFDAIAGLFLSHIDDMKDEAFTKAFYKNLLSSIAPEKKTPEE
jgi:hypothetical protein